MSRNLQTQVVKRFRGLNVWSSFTNTSPEQATDLLNVIPSNSGGLEKMRIPTTLSQPVVGQGSGPDSFAQFRSSNVPLQVLAQFGNLLGFYDTSWNFTGISSDARNGQGIFDYLTVNNLEFLCNGAVNWKWTGALIQPWGITAPPIPTFSNSTAPPANAKNIGAAATTNSLGGGVTVSRTGNITTVFGTGAFGMVAGDIVLIDSVADNSFNGIFIVRSDTSPGAPIRLDNVGPDGTSTGGNATDFNQAGIYRYNNEVTVTTTTAHGLNPGDLITIAGVTDTSFNGNFVTDSVISTTMFTYAQTGPAASSGGGTETPRNTAPTFTLGGRQYRISYMNTNTGHVSTASPASAATGNLDGTINATVTTAAPNDPQVNAAILWSTIDGGADFYFNQQISITPLTAPVFQDTTLDNQLNTAIVAPLINDPPPVGKYLWKWNGRTFIGNINGDPQGIVYSGFERILIGRPEESFPPNNRLKLAIGADPIRGIGSIAQGLIAFSQSNQMYMLSGTVQDIAVDAPVPLSAFLRELPWAMGSYSHFSGVQTPQGFVWLASDKTIQLYDGSQPKCLSDAFNPILRRITSSTESNVRGTFFNYLEREWYALTCAIDNSSTNNLIVFIDLNPDPNVNVGAFLCSLEADHIDVVEDGSGARQLVISNGGLIKMFLALSDTVNGISNPITATTGTLGAYWKSGVFGNDTPQQIKMFRWAHIVRDQMDIRVKVYMIKEEDDFRYPEILDFSELDQSGRFSVNDKGRRAMFELRFSDADASANILELGCTYIPVAER